MDDSVMLFPTVTYPPLPYHIGIHAKERPHHPALIEGDREISYADLDDQIRRGANRLQLAGIGQGDRVLVAVSNKTNLILAVLSSMAAGAPVMPVAFAEEDIVPVAEYFDPKIIIIDPAHPQSARIAISFPTLPVETLTSAAPSDLAPVTHEDIGLLILTSGTTQGQRRGTLLSHRALSGSAEFMNQRMGIDNSVRDLVTSPLEHGFGMGRVRSGLHAGGTIVVQSVLFSPSVVVDALTHYECNMLSAPIVTVGMLLDSEIDTLRTLKNQIKWMELGSSHLKPAHRRTLLEILPHTRCFVSYGLTEAIRCTFLELNADREKIDSVGKATTSVLVRIVDDNGSPVPTGQEGRIQVDGVNKASGYFRYPEAWQNKLHGQWLESGDVGFVDEDGFLTFVGRNDDMINVGGLKVAPEEVEIGLVPLLEGVNFTVARVPDPLGIEGFVPGLFIETEDAPPISLQEVRTHLRSQLPEFKIPRTITAIARLPRTTTTNKIRRPALTEIAIKTELEQIPKTPHLLVKLGEPSRLSWPAIDGSVTISRRQIKQFIDGCDPENPRQNKFTAKILPLRQMAANDDLEIGRLIDQCDRMFPGHGDASIAFGLTTLNTPIIQAAMIKTLAANGICIQLPSVEGMLVAEDLGWVKRYCIRTLLTDSARFSRYAMAEDHLRSSFDGSAFAQLVILGPVPDPLILTRFHRTFGITPYHLLPVSGQWHLRALPPPKDPGTRAEGREIWSSLCALAAGVFDIPVDSLRFDSSAENTPGWNSLGFVNLIMAVEEDFAVQLTPRDIMAVRHLGDLEAILTEDQRL